MGIFERKYKDGVVVCEKLRPSQKLTIVQFLNGLYYCKIQEHDSDRQLVYFESELEPYVHFVQKQNLALAS
jgi:hypothetical protein